MITFFSQSRGQVAMAGMGSALAVIGAGYLGWIAFVTNVMVSGRALVLDVQVEARKAGDVTSQALVRFRFDTPAGPHVDEDRLEADDELPKPGQTLEIAYLPAQPAAFVIRPSTLSWKLGLMLFLGGLILIAPGAPIQYAEAAADRIASWISPRR
jgi:hypothetical protein